jgi:hypothetical protein
MFSVLVVLISPVWVEAGASHMQIKGFGDTTKQPSMIMNFKQD